MNFVAYLILRLGIFFVFLLLSAPFLFGLGLVVEFCEQHDSLRILKFPVGVLILLWFLATGWLVQQTANHMMFENKKLGQAMKMSFRDARFHLAFLPVIGSWFVSGREKHD